MVHLKKQNPKPHLFPLGYAPFCALFENEESAEWIEILATLSWVDCDQIKLYLLDANLGPMPAKIDGYSYLYSMSCHIGKSCVFVQDQGLTL